MAGVPESFDRFWRKWEAAEIRSLDERATDLRRHYLRLSPDLRHAFRSAVEGLAAAVPARPDLLGMLPRVVIATGGDDSIDFEPKELLAIMRSWEDDRGLLAE